MTSWPSHVDGGDPRDHIPNWRRMVFPAVVLSIVLVLAGSAVIIARGDAAQAIAEEARVLAWSESVASFASTLRGEIREGIVIGQAAELGAFDQWTVADSAARIETAVTELEERIDLLVGLEEDDELESVGSVVSGLSLEIAEALRAGEPERAFEAGGRIAPAFTELAQRTTQLSTDSSDHIAAVTSGLGTVTTAARFVSALLIPILAIWILYRALRRSEKVSILRSELARERELRHKKDAFLAAASHHIRTPLAAVVGFAALLRDKTRDFNAGVRYEITELMAMEADETSNVVDDLFAAARYDLGNLELDEEEIELRDVIDAATSDWASNHRMRLTITGSARVVGDKHWLTHAIRNLLRNAASFGGERITVNVQRALNRVVIEIIDNGEGIPDEERDRIFELYYSYRQVLGLAPNLGLGLSVARSIARAMGGDVTYYRLDDENVFEMRLPAATSARDTQLIHLPRTIDPRSGVPTLESITEVLTAGGPRMVYQPIVDLVARQRGEQRIIGYEALARFDAHEPADWFRAASALGLRLDLELMCISSAIAQFAPPQSDAFLAVNLSDRTLHSSRLEDVIDGFDPTRVVLELSEAASIKSYEETSRVLDALFERGLRLAVDDVGAAEVDLWHMVRLGAQIIKIDISLIRDLGSSPRNRGMIKGVAAMARELGALVVAEGAETEEEHALLVEVGVEFGQGNVYARPQELIASEVVMGTVTGLNELGG